MIKELRPVADQAFVSKLAQIIKKSGVAVNEIVCYGLGSISVSIISRHQLAVLVLLAEHLHITRCSVWDPVITSDEWLYLENDLKMQRAEFPPLQVDRVLFYMPHCYLDTYEACVSAGAQAFIGNDLHVYKDRLGSDQVYKNAPSIASSAFKVVGLPLYCPREDVFNDTFLVLK